MIVFFVAVLLTHCATLTSCDDMASQKYVALTSSGRSPVCAVDQPTSTVAVRSKVHCAAKCTKRSSCFVHQMNDATKQCQLYDYLPTNYSGPVQHCSTFVRDVPSALRTVEADSCSFPFTYNGQLYHTCSVNSSTGTSPSFAWCPLLSNGVHAVCSFTAYGFVAQNVTVNVTIPTTPVATFVPMRSVNGWLIVMSRVGGNWPTGLSYNAYKAGFGDVMSYFWLGLDNIYTLTNSAVNGGHTYRVRFEFLSSRYRWHFVEYAAFSLGSPASNYVLHVSNTATGDAFDALNSATSPANGAAFQTSGACVTNTYGFFWYPGHGCCHVRWFGVSGASYGGFFWNDPSDSINYLQIFRMMVIEVY